jgi:hypothetical protein
VNGFFEVLGMLFLCFLESGAKGERRLGFVESKEVFIEELELTTGLKLIGVE